MDMHAGLPVNRYAGKYKTAIEATGVPLDRYLMEIGDRIQTRLDALGMSQNELARRTKLSQSTINGLLTGRARSSRSLHVIARELQTTVEYLAGETDDPNVSWPDEAVTSDDMRCLVLWRQLSDSDKETVRALMQSLVR